MKNNSSLNKPKVAVELAVYNGIKWLPEQIKSILVQEEIDVTIFLSIDPSSDGSEVYCRAFAEQENRIKILPSTYKFGGAARNFFRLIRDVDIENFEYIAYSDQDDIWDSKKISHAIRCLQKSNSEAYSSNLIAFDTKSHKHWTLKKNGIEKKIDYLFQGASAGCTYVLSNKAAYLVKQKIGLDHSQFPEGCSHDWLIYAICRSYYLKWYFDDAALIKYRQHDNNVYGALPGIGGYIVRYRNIKNGWYKKNILWIAEFIKGDEYELKVLNAIRRLSFSDRIWLALNSLKFRRYKKDCIFLSIIFLMGAI